ncbi:hypothetical protein [Stenotrophomonas lactitubi]|uniref:hypothetical protein n=1 Tax=Stenotrophomonas lactitubi TaxID=2045214 RepID=UPI001E2A8DC0|nr:hypothetical protein [Stenotrophomonas lactitubi]
MLNDSAGLCPAFSFAAALQDFPIGFSVQPAPLEQKRSAITHDIQFEPGLAIPFFGPDVEAFLGTVHFDVVRVPQGGILGLSLPTNMDVAIVASTLDLEKEMKTVLLFIRVETELRAARICGWLH